MEKERLTARQAAKKLIDVYVRRGDSLESLRLSHMGRAGRDFTASIGGSCFRWAADGTRELVRQFSTTHIGVSRLGDQEMCEVFPLKELYEEIQRENDPTAPKQITLASEVTEVYTTPAVAPKVTRKAPGPTTGYKQEGLF